MEFSILARDMPNKERVSNDYSALIAVKSLSYKDWIPAFAGMTLNPALYVIPAQAGIQPIK